MQIVVSLLHPTARSPPPFFQSQACAALLREELGVMAGDFGGPGGLSRARECPPAFLLFLSPPKSLAYIWRLPPSVPLSYGPPWAQYLGGYQDRLLGGPLGLPGLRCTSPDGVKHKDYRGEVLG
jgi:hypothetical protein